MANNEKQTKTWREVKGKVQIRQGVKAPWYEMTIVDRSGKERKLVAKEVDKFLSESWEKEEGL